jgi:hypothetical protein
MLLKRTFLLIILPAIFAGGMIAQIYSPEAGDSITAKYGTDKVFIFNRPAYLEEINASILAITPDNLSDWNFQWYFYSHADNSYIPIPGVSTGRTSLIDTITVTSGFRVIMTKGLVSDTFRVWVMINDLDVRITNKDEADTLKFGYYNCTSVDLMADSTLPIMVYYNPDTHQKIAFPYTYRIKWTTNNNTSDPIPSNRLLTRVTDPPADDTWYIITITDNFGLKRSDSVYYKTIQSRAEFRVNYLPLEDDTLEYGNRPWIGWFYSPGERSAPGKYQFNMSDSKNMVKYELVFGDGDTARLSSDSSIVIHEYERPGTYTAILTTISASPDECPDTLSNKTDVVLDYATQENFGELPNVFTPDEHWNNVFKMPEDASLNDIFRTSDVSVVFIDIAIYSRTGLKVHEFEGNIRDWPGWDGYIMKSNRKAPEGVYFYVISRLIAYEDDVNPINKKNMKGFIHLYRRD